MPFWSGVEQPDRIWSEQPFVIGGYREIRLYVLSAKEQRAQRLREIERQRGSDLAANFANLDQVKPSTTGPLNVRNRGDGDIGGQRIEDGCSPVIIIWPRHNLERRAPLFGQSLPHIVIGRKLLDEHENALP